MSNRPRSFKKKGNSRAKRFVPKERAHRQSMYNKDWSNYRFRYLHHNPKCYCCASESKVIDHVVPHKGNDKLFWNITNYIPLCKSCHNTITAKFDRHGSHLMEEKMKWMESQRKLNGVDVKVKVVERKTT